MDPIGRSFRGFFRQKYIPSSIVALRYRKIFLTASKCIAEGLVEYCASLMTGNDMSGRHVTMAYISSPMACRYPKPICFSYFFSSSSVRVLMFPVYVCSRCLDSSGGEIRAYGVLLHATSRDEKISW